MIDPRSSSPSRPPAAPARAAVLFAALLFAASLLAACGEPAAGPAGEGAGPAATGADAAAADTPQPPSGPGAMAPQLAAAADGAVLLSWLEPEGDGHRLRVARWTGGAWGEAATVAAGDSFFANWADTPGVVDDGAGGAWAYWFEKLGGGTYAYGVQTAHSADGGATWHPLGLLHDDRSASEHGFVTMLPAAGGGVDAVWLDGRQTAAGGAMTLRTRRLGGDGDPAGGAAAAPGGPEAVIDDRVCDCCSTAAATTDDGLLVAYRDRSADEVRDVSVARRQGDRWGTPHPLHRDGWTIPGCPVNGPELAARGRRVAAAWFTAAGDRPRVLAAWSADSGDTWSHPVEVDAEAPLGRAGIALLPDGSAAISWLAADGAIRLRRLAADGRPGPPATLAVTAASRAAGVPRLLATADTLYAAWVDPGTETTPSRIRFATLDPAALPQPG